MTTRRKISSGHVGAGQRPAPSRRQALRAALASVGALSLAGCDGDMIGRTSDAVGSLSHAAHRVVTGRTAMAQEFTQADVAAHFKANGTLVPADADYHALMKGGFKDWKLQVGGLVEQPAAFSLAELHAMPSRTQITRHDCVEGWSTIGKWKGVQLSHVLGLVRPLPSAKFVVFRCLDSMDDPAPTAADSKYYESVDLDDAYHVQTVLAYELNDQPLPVNNGAPLRVRIERQLGYKHAKYLSHIELIESFDKIRDGHGGYWEDNGYEWYGGI
jgi:DMSO/TMAO reductase YedYZ molybdopterin-dependent catalytic subunit